MYLYTDDSALASVVETSSGALLVVLNLFVGLKGVWPYLAWLLSNDWEEAKAHQSAIDLANARIKKSNSQKARTQKWKPYAKGRRSFTVNAMSLMKSGSESRGINLALSPALNTALREEMLFFATQGIRDAADGNYGEAEGVLTQSSATLSTHIGGVGVETRWHVRHYNTAQYAFEFQEDVGDGTDDSIASVGVEKHRRGSSRFGSFFRSTKRSSDAGLEISNTSTWPKVNSSADSSSQISSFDVEKGSTPSTDYRPATKPSSAPAT